MRFLLEICNLLSFTSYIKESAKASTVPETILKKRKAVEKLAAARLAHRKSQIAKNKRVRQVIIKKAESYVKEYKDKEKEEIRMKREAKAAGNYYVPDESKLAFVVRIKGYVVSSHCISSFCELSCPPAYSMDVSC